MHCRKGGIHGPCTMYFFMEYAKVKLYGNDVMVIYFKQLQENNVLAVIFYYLYYLDRHACADFILPHFCVKCNCYTNVILFYIVCGEILCICTSKDFILAIYNIFHCIAWCVSVFVDLTKNTTFPCLIKKITLTCLLILPQNRQTVNLLIDFT